MRIERIEADNFLSFERLVLDGLDTKLNVVVGPNGAGKTNLIRVMKMVRDALEAQTRSAWDRATRVSTQSGGFGARIQLELTEEWEKQFVTSFFQAELASRPNVPETLLDPLLEWVEKTSVSAFEALFRGTLEVTCSAGPEFQWIITYRLEHEGALYQWALDGARMLGISRAPLEPETPLRGMPPLGHLVHSGMSPEEELEALAHIHSHSFKVNDVLPEPGQLLQPEVRSLLTAAVPEPVRRFAELGGLKIFGESRVYSGLQVFELLLRRGIILTDDIRTRPQEEWIAEDLVKSPESMALDDGRNLPLYLFRLKNGHREERRRYQNSQDIFRHLTGRSFGLLLEPDADRSGSSRADRFRLLMTVVHDDEEIPMPFAGAGLWEALILSVVLSAQKGRILCLDEPALNLHPNLQRQVLRMIERRDGQCFMITHSPYLVPVRDKQDLARVVRFHQQGGATQVSRLGSTMLQDAEGLAKWLKEIGRGADGPALLFAQGVILVEGETESGALPLWFSKSRTASEHGSLEDNNLTVHWVGGAQGFGNYVRFLGGFSIPWVVVCDGDQFKNEQFWKQFDLPAAEDGAPFENARDAAARRAVFTLAKDFGLKFEDLPYVEPLLAEAEQEVGRSKVRQGRYVAAKVDCPPDVDDVYRRILFSLGVIGEQAS